MALQEFIKKTAKKLRKIFDVQIHAETRPCFLILVHCVSYNCLKYTNGMKILIIEIKKLKN